MEKKYEKPAVEAVEIIPEGAILTTSREEGEFDEGRDDPL